MPVGTFSPTTLIPHPFPVPHLRVVSKFGGFGGATVPLPTVVLLVVAVPGSRALGVFGQREYSGLEAAELVFRSPPRVWLVLDRRAAEVQVVVVFAHEGPSHAESDNPSLLLLHIKNAQLKVDVEWLGEMICVWPVPFPPQDDGAILWAFIRQFMSWRDGVRHMPETGQPVTAEGRVNCLVRQMKNIISLEQVLGEWKEETLKACVDHNLTPNPEPGGSLGAAIQANITKRLLREAMMVSLLGSLVTAWRNHISGMLSTGPGLYSDVGLLRRCLSITEEHQTFGEILKAHSASRMGAQSISKSSPSAVRVRDRIQTLDSLGIAMVRVT
ncbi:hypothetical protein B0H11DRAFT_2332816 [Mycena galericulata]|nr:hypothetical protein B0H11DRAFT_2332816 [Mycena galericulata]